MKRNKITIRPIDRKRLKEEFGDRMCFWGGGCDTQHVLSRATPDEVRRHRPESLGSRLPRGGSIKINLHPPPRKSRELLQDAHQLHLIIRRIQAQSELRDQVMPIDQVRHGADCTYFGSPKQ